MRKRYAKLLGLACLIGAMGLLPSSQSRAAGWLKDGNYWYYMTDDGQKHTGWVHIGEKYYYRSPFRIRRNSSSFSSLLKRGSLDVLTPQISTL